jgi:predicted HTH transcriptional regulator
MNKKELNQILQKGEGQFVEFKEYFDKDLAKEIVAFANASGGKIFLGINDDNQISGLSITNRLLADLISKTIFMERVGTGIKRIKKFCKENNNEVEIKPTPTHFFVKMKALELPSTAPIKDGISDGISDGIKDGVSDGVKDGIKAR